MCFCCGTTLLPSPDGQHKGRAAAQPGDTKVRVDVKRSIELPRPRWGQQRPEPVIGLCAGGIARGRDPPCQRVDRRPDDAFRAQLVAGQLQQQRWRVVFQRAVEHEPVGRDGAAVHAAVAGLDPGRSGCVPGV